MLIFQSRQLLLYMEQLLNMAMLCFESPKKLIDLNDTITFVWTKRKVVSPAPHIFPLVDSRGHLLKKKKDPQDPQLMFQSRHGLICLSQKQKQQTGYVLVNNNSFGLYQRIVVATQLPKEKNILREMSPYFFFLHQQLKFSTECQSPICITELLLISTWKQHGGAGSEADCCSTQLDQHNDQATRISLLEKGLLAFSQLLPRQVHALYS